MSANSNRPEPIYLFEMQRGVMRIRFEQFKILISESSNRLWKITVMPPESGRSQMLHSFSERPDSWSCSASVSKESNRPAFTSCSSCLSQSWAWNSSNHSANSATFVGGNWAIALSISLTSITGSLTHPSECHQLGSRTPAFSCGARSASKLKEKDYLRNMLSRRQLQGFVGRRCRNTNL